MAWGSVDVEEQRMRFVVAVSRREKPLHSCAWSLGFRARLDTSGGGDIKRAAIGQWWKKAGVRIPVQPEPVMLWSNE
jgi:hypothetical protein